jgi:hypothetical protein
MQISGVADIADERLDRPDGAVLVQLHDDDVLPLEKSRNIPAGSNASKSCLTNRDIANLVASAPHQVALADVVSGQMQVQRSESHWPCNRPCTSVVAPAAKVTMMRTGRDG